MTPFAMLSWAKIKSVPCNTGYRVEKREEQGRCLHMSKWFWQGCRGNHAGKKKESRASAKWKCTFFEVNFDLWLLLVIQNLIKCPLYSKGKSEISKLLDKKNIGEKIELCKEFLIQRKHTEIQTLSWFLNLVCSVEGILFLEGKPIVT